MYESNYNPMLQMNNIRFSYTEKDQNLTHSQNSPREKQGVGRLLSRNERSGPFDDEQEQQISKKKTIYQGSSLNYAQIYSDIRINKNEKIQPKADQSLQQSRIANHSFTSNSYNKQESLNKNSTANAPKSLPKIMRDSRLYNNLTPSRANQKNTYSEVPVEVQTKQPFSRKKVFSISHYDIYRPGQIVNRNSSLSAKQEEEAAKIEQPSDDGVHNTIAKSQVQEQLERQLPQQELKIDFENQQDRDIPQTKVDLSISKEFSREIKRSRVSERKQKVTSRKQVEQQKIEVKLESSSIKKSEAPLSEKKEHKVQLQQARSEAERKQSIKIVRAESKHIDNSLLIEEVEQVSLQPVKRQRDPINIKKVSQPKIETIINTVNLSEEKQLDPKQQKQEKKQEKVIPHEEIHPKQRQIKFIVEESQKVQDKKQQESYRPYEYHKFNVADYMKIYDILKSIHTFLKTNVPDSHSLIKQIKRYLQTVAGGSLDHIQGYDMPLHRLKIVKNALLFQRIAIVIICFAYSVGKLKDSLKFIINLVSYAINNTLLILKILQSSDLSKQASKNPIIAKSDRLVLKKNYDTVRNNNDIIQDSIFKISKYEQVFSQTFKDILKSVGKNSLEQTFYNVLQYFAFFLCVSELHMTLPFLAVAPNPYLRETLDKRPTLVIDIVEIFCHGTRKSKSHVFRPHTEHFLHEMSQYYEVVSFTCAYPNQIDKVIDILDPKKHIKQRLYRHHTIWRNNITYKDTQRIGRDLNKLILLDSSNNTIMGQSNNTIMIPIWKGNKNDTTLAELCPILAAIAIKNLDCKQATIKIHEQQVKNESAGIKYLNFGINLE